MNVDLIFSPRGPRDPVASPSDLSADDELSEQHATTVTDSGSSVVKQGSTEDNEQPSKSPVDDADAEGAPSLRTAPSKMKEDAALGTGRSAAQDMEEWLDNINVIDLAKNAWKRYEAADSNTKQTMGAGALAAVLLITVSWPLIGMTVKAAVVTLIIGALAIAYAELMYQATWYLFKNNVIKRYHYPMPTSRHYLINYLNAAGFTFVCAFYWFNFTKAPMDFSFNLGTVAALLPASLVYMVIHDAWFFLMHKSSHRFKFLWYWLHEHHHGAVKGLNVFHVGYAEVIENTFQVGPGWLIWTILCGNHFWLMILPLSFSLFTTLLGHSGFKMHPILTVLHPLAFPITFVAGTWMLTPGDHQVHHAYRSYNFALFFSWWDRHFKTFRKYDVQPKFYKDWLVEAEKNPSLVTDKENLPLW